MTSDSTSAIPPADSPGIPPAMPPAVPPADDDAIPARGRGRSFGAGVLGVVAVIGLVGGAIGRWTIDTAADSERFEERVATLLEDDEISDALGRRVVTELTEAIGLQEAISDSVPEILQPAIELLAAGARSRLEDRVAELVRSPEVAAVIAGAAGRAHALAVDVIEGDAGPEGLQVRDGEVRVNLLPLMAKAVSAMQEIGLLRDVAVPELDSTGDPDEQRAELAAALGRDVPDDFGTPVVLRSESLAQIGDSVQLVRDALVLAKRAVWLLLFTGVAFAGASIWLSRERVRSVAFIVAGLVVSAFVVRVVMGRATDRLPDAVEQSGAKLTVSKLASELESSLNQSMSRYAVLALVALGIAGVAHLDLIGRLRRRRV
ncbi:MAG: hypothetical protein ACE37B_19075 [Ilumatobacter sp.]|uniref:hypothetical protein n=1 Tax=Ilumatobacter sp. TaxID=1967498 RepID=UPI00391A008C